MEMANDALKKLEAGGLKIAQQHNDIQQGVEHMSFKIFKRNLITTENTK